MKANAMARNWERQERPPCRIHEVMSWPALAVGPLVWAEVALQHAEEHGVRRLLVLSTSGLLGIVETDSLRSAAADALVLDCTVDDALELHPDDTPDEAGVRFDEHGIDLAVCYWRGAYGIVTRGDVRRAQEEQGGRQPRSGAYLVIEPEDADYDALYYRDVGGGD